VPPPPGFTSSATEPNRIGPSFRYPRYPTRLRSKLVLCAETAQVADERFRLLSGPGAYERYGDRGVVRGPAHCVCEWTLAFA
jgi:hypothetical protein